MTENNEQPEVSRIIIEFVAPGSVIFRMIPENVIPMQLLAVAGYLELSAKNQIIMQENIEAERRKQTEIAVPKQHGAIHLGK